MQTMPAVHQDQWWRPMSDIPITEPRWVRMVEIRPTNIQGRKILHHSIAYHVLNPDNADRASTPASVAVRSGRSPASPDDLANRRARS